MEWFSYAVAVILLISSIVSPITTTIINNIHQTNIKKLEMYELSKRNALEDFVKCASKCFDAPSLGYLYDYYNSLNNLYIYFSDVPPETNNLISLKGTSFNQQLTSIVVKLSSEIKKS